MGDPLELADVNLRYGITMPAARDAMAYRDDALILVESSGLATSGSAWKVRTAQASYALRIASSPRS